MVNDHGGIATGHIRRDRCSRLCAPWGQGPPIRWKSRELADRIGFVFQNPEHQFVSRTVAEELRVAPKVMRVKPPEERITQLVDSLRLEHLWRRTLSLFQEARSAAFQWLLRWLPHLR